MIESSETDDFIDPDENTNPFAEITQKIQSLEKSKISSIDIDGHTVHFMPIQKRPHSLERLLCQKMLFGQLWRLRDEWFTNYYRHIL